MSVSVTTLIEAVNRVLLDVGERSTTTFARPAANKAQAYLRDAFNDVQLAHEWEWLYLTQTPDTWSTDSATFENIRRINRVSWDTGDGFREIPYLDLESFDQYDITSFAGATDTSTRPLFYTKTDEDTIRLNPYPTDSTGRSKVKAKVIKFYTAPSTTTGVFSCPERFINLIQKRAAAMMFARHLGDMSSASVLEQEFQTLLRDYKTKESLVPSKGFNMFRREVRIG